MDDNTMRTFEDLQERLNAHYSEGGRVGGITLCQVRKLLTDAQYLLMNLEMDNVPFHVDIRVEFEESLEDLYRRIVKNIDKQLNKGASFR